MPHEGRLADAVLPHERDEFATTQRELDILEERDVGIVADAQAARLEHDLAALGRRRAWQAVGPAVLDHVQHVARVLDGHRQAAIGSSRRRLPVQPLGEETRDRGQQFAVVGDRPPGELLRVGVDHDAAAVEVEHARGEVQTALDAVLGEDDRGARVFGQPADGGEQLLGADRVEL